METKEYFEKVMQDFRSAMPFGSSKNQHRNGRSLRNYCQDEGIDHKWLQEYKRAYPNEPRQQPEPEPQSFIPLAIEEEKDQPKPVWQVSHLRLESPDGGFIDINSSAPTDMRKGREGLCGVVREVLERSPGSGFFDPFLIKGLKYPVRNKSH